MKPNPLAALNHFTVPCSIVLISLLLMNLPLDPNRGRHTCKRRRNQSVSNECQKVTTVVSDFMHKICELAALHHFWCRIRRLAGRLSCWGDPELRSETKRLTRAADGSERSVPHA